MTAEENKLLEYKIQFEFTTVHRRSQFIGRNGECYVTAEQKLNDADKLNDELLKICAKAVHSLKPKWNIFLLNIKSIQKL